MYSIFRLTCNYYDGPGHGSKVRTKKVFEHLLPTMCLGTSLLPLLPLRHPHESLLRQSFQRVFVHLQGFNKVESDPSVNGTTRPLTIESTLIETIGK